MIQPQTPRNAGAAMKPLRLVILLLLPSIALCQDAHHECIDFHGGDPISGVEKLAIDPLSTAVTLSGDFDFYSTPHVGCWSVNVIALLNQSQSGAELGYAISYTVTNPEGVEFTHQLLIGPDQSLFDKAMRDAAAKAIKNIRLIEKLNEKLDLKK